MTRVTLLLAQGPDKPDGDINDKLELDLVLTGTGQIDVSAHDAAPSPWRARRNLAGRADVNLEIIRVDEGWALQSTSSLDDPIWAFEGHVFRPGELVRLHSPAGDDLLYRIVNTEQMHEATAGMGAPG